MQECSQNNEKPPLPQRLRELFPFLLVPAVRKAVADAADELERLYDGDRGDARV